MRVGTKNNQERDPRVVEHAWKTNEGGVIKFQSENKTPKNNLIKWVDINEIVSKLIQRNLAP